ncbi:ATP-binding protein [Streptomyces phaeochromogenes]
MKPLTLDLLAVPKAVPEVRRAVREHLGVPCPEVELCVSELLANVIVHLGEETPVSVRLTHEGDRIRLEVTDPDPYAWLILRRATGDDETGRGLLLLDAVAVRWGVEQGPGGKTVWCELSGGARDAQPEQLQVPQHPRPGDSQVCPTGTYPLGQNRGADSLCAFERR